MSEQNSPNPSHAGSGSSLSLSRPGTKAGLPYDQKELARTNEEINLRRALRLQERNKRMEEAKAAAAEAARKSRALALEDQEEIAIQEDENMLITAPSPVAEGSVAMSFKDRQTMSLIWGCPPKLLLLRLLLVFLLDLLPSIHP